MAMTILTVVLGCRGKIHLIRIPLIYYILYMHFNNGLQLFKCSLL